MSPDRKAQRLLKWSEARRRHHLSQAHIHMARELGLNPAKLGKLDNHDQERWKLPLPAFIEQLYVKRFGRLRPDVTPSIEEHAKLAGRKAVARREARRPVPNSPASGLPGVRASERDDSF